MFYWVLKIIFGPLVRLIWVRKVEGLESMPKNGPYIVAANHSSYFDFFSLIAVWPSRIYFLAGEVFFKKWWWYPLVKFTGQIRVDRSGGDKTEAKEKVFSLLKRGKIIGIFPEGTRSATGEIGKIYTGVAKFALEAQVPVVPVGISGAFEVMSRHDSFPKLKKIISVKIGKPMHFEDGDLRQITDKIMEEIKKLSHE